MHFTFFLIYDKMEQNGSEVRRVKYYIKEKFFSFKDKFYIYDESGNEKYYVEGEFFSIGKKLHLYSKDGEELLLIKQKIWSFLPKFSIEINGKEAERVVRHFSLKPSYSMVERNWEIYGNFVAHDYSIMDNGLPVATIKKEWLTWADTYSIDIAPYADELMAIAAVLVIDAAEEAGENSVDGIIFNP